MFNNRHQNSSRSRHLERHIVSPSCVSRSALVVAVLLSLAAATPLTWAEDQSPNDSTTRSGSSEDEHLRIEDLPKPVQDALKEIQRLSAKIEPAVERFGSRFRQEVDQAIKNLRDGLKTQRRRDASQ